MDMDANKLKEILEKHKKWLLQEDGGERADLRYADLRNADLRDTYLRYA
ncbi:MAG: pentapeptide repeat-containing protein, partial [Oscillospiraceae bacterium]|nr:pentapeptide repeat-containing protein [Oscillospiraceae bacterium]